MPSTTLTKVTGSKPFSMQTRSKILISYAFLPRTWLGCHRCLNGELGTISLLPFQQQDSVLWRFLMQLDFLLKGYKTPYDSGLQSTVWLGSCPSSPSLHMSLLRGFKTLSSPDLDGLTCQPHPPHLHGSPFFPSSPNCMEESSLFLWENTTWGVASSGPALSVTEQRSSSLS